MDINTTKPFGLIYKVTNITNGKIYIGQTVKKLSIRKSQHYYDAKNGSKSYFHLALIKYGFDKFKWETIELCFDIHDCNEKEKLNIHFYQSTDRNKGYNIDFGGNSTVRNEETKQKIKLSKQNVSQETRKKLSIANLGKKQSEETKEKLRTANLGKIFSDETRKKLKENNVKYWKNKKLSEESVAKRSEKRNIKIICNESGKIYNSIKEAQSSLGISHISEHLKGKINKIKNYTFQYYENQRNN
jgi:group I intron endonuclease